MASKHFLSLTPYYGTGTISDAEERSSYTLGVDADKPLLEFGKFNVNLNAGLHYFTADVKSVERVCLFNDCLRQNFDEGSTSSNLSLQTGCRGEVKIGKLFTLSGVLGWGINRVAIDAKVDGHTVDDSVDYNLGLYKGIGGDFHFSDQLAMRLAFTIHNIDEQLAFYDIFGDYRVLYAGFQVRI